MESRGLSWREMRGFQLAGEFDRILLMREGGLVRTMDEKYIALQKVDELDQVTST